MISKHKLFVDETATAIKVVFHRWLFAALARSNGFLILVITMNRFGDAKSIDLTINCESCFTTKAMRFGANLPVRTEKSLSFLNRMRIPHSGEINSSSSDGFFHIPFKKNLIGEPQLIIILSRGGVAYTPGYGLYIHVHTANWSVVGKIFDMEMTVWVILWLTFQAVFCGVRLETN